MTPKRRYMAPTYIIEQMADMALDARHAGRQVKRRSLRAAHRRFREYAGPPVHLEPTDDGRILATFEPTLEGYQHDPEIL